MKGIEPDMLDGVSIY